MTIPLTNDATPVSTTNDPLADASIPSTDIVAVEEGIKKEIQSTSPYGHLTEVRNLQWEDRFYAENPSVVAVFDYDKEKCRLFTRRVTRAWLAVIILEGLLFAGLAALRFVWGLSFIGLLWLFLALYFFYRAYQLQKALRCLDQVEQHVAITNEGIQLDVRGHGDVSNVTVTVSKVARQAGTNYGC